MEESTVKEPAVRAKLSADNTALFETKYDYLMWAACISPFKEFDRFCRQVDGGIIPIRFYERARRPESKAEVKAILGKTMCTNGSTLFEVMRNKIKGL